MKTIGLIVVCGILGLGCGGTRRGGDSAAAEEAMVRARAFRDNTCACADGTASACLGSEAEIRDARRARQQDRALLAKLHPSAAFKQAYMDLYAATAACAERSLRKAEAAQAAAEADRVAAEAAQAALEVEVEGFRKRLADLGKQMDEANQALMDARSKAERDRAAERQAAIREQQRQLQAEIEQRRRGRP